MTRAFTIVMAGGSGTRFWPLSRRARPKQLLCLAGEKESLLAAAVRRAHEISALADIMVVTNERLGPATRAELPNLTPQNVLLEPVGRNTAACIGWAATRVAQRDEGAVCVVLPADHYIGDEDRYAATLTRAIEVARDGGIVTVGVQPTRPETGYGYIELGERIGEDLHRVARFVEKPDLERATAFASGETHLWNSGIFVFKASVMLEAIRSFLPALSGALARIAAAGERDEASVVGEVYPGLDPVSIDHGVMEKAGDVRVLAADFGWSDIGSFQSTWELADKDDDDNALHADAIMIDARGCYVSAPRRKVVAVVGLSDLVVVDTEDALLIIPKHRSQDVKELVAELEAREDHRR